MEWITSNWEQLIVIVLAVLGAASAIAKVTPTEIDNKIIDKVLSVIHALGLTKK